MIITEQLHARAGLAVDAIDGGERSFTLMMLIQPAGTPDRGLRFGGTPAEPVASDYDDDEDEDYFYDDDDDDEDDIDDDFDDDEDEPDDEDDDEEDEI